MASPEQGPGRGARSVRPPLPFLPFRKEDIEQSIPARFDEQVKAHPDRLAVKAGSRSLTYQALDHISNRIAHGILARRGQGEEPVALALEQGTGLVAAILGALKAGKMYVPIDPSDPHPRLAALLADTGARLVVTDSTHIALSKTLDEAGRTVISVDELGEGHSTEAPGVSISPDALAYLFYTSGSTGRPKGVADTHRNVLHNIMRYTNSLRIGPSDRLTLLQSATFSGSVSSLFGALLNGAASFPFDVKKEGPGRLSAWLSLEGITMYHSVPTIFRSFLTGALSFPQVRIIRLEGDRGSRVDVDLYRRHFAADCLLVIGLGATETGLTRQYFIRKDTDIADGILPIGFPVEDMHALLLDDEGHEVAMGTVGEIAIKSKYLAPGYWRNPGQTRQAFVPAAAGQPERIYRTADLGRMRPDGCLEYHGRKDFQVKVRGHGVDVAEVEAMLLRLDTVREAVVATHQDHAGEGLLVAYLVPANGAAPTAGSLRDALAETLPDYMIPSRYFALKQIPLDPNGKVNRRLLQSADAVRLDDAAPFIGPRDAVERQLLAIWRVALGVDAMGIQDNFFDLGGDSLSAARVFVKIEELFGVRLPLSRLAQAPTVERLAALLRVEQAPRDRSSLVPIQPSGSRPPFLGVHDHDGSVFRFVELARELSPDQPLYAFEAPGATREENSLSRIEAMAARYLTDLRRLQPRGPYFLGGFCYGAVVAFELAHQLWAQGETVAFLALMGISPSDFPRLVPASAWRRYRRLQPPGWLRRGLARVRGHAGQILRLPPQERYLYIKSGLAWLAGRLKRKVRGAAYDLLWHLASAPFHLLHRPLPTFLRDPERANTLAFRAYTPRTYPGQIDLFLSRETKDRYFSNPDLDWSTFASGGVTIHEVPGNDRMMHEPHLHVLAERLDQRLRETQAAAALVWSR